MPLPELPRPPIDLVLRECAGEDIDVPTGFGWVRMHCPFHEDRGASASVNHEVGAFKCHSCGRQGDALKMLQNELGIDFREALDRARALDGEPAAHARPARRRRASDLLGRQG